MLLLQHLALTFAALSLVRDRELGVLELLRVGPLSSIEILAGKTIAYLARRQPASVPSSSPPPCTGSACRSRGDVDWAAVAVVLGAAGVAGARHGAVADLGTETQAVQFAMLSLLAGMFFSGFILDVDGLTEPYRYISYLLAGDVRHRHDAGRDAARRRRPNRRT